MKKCPKCQSKVLYPDDAAFCGKCGSPLVAYVEEKKKKEGKLLLPLLIGGIVFLLIVILVLVVLLLKPSTTAKESENSAAGQAAATEAATEATDPYAAADLQAEEIRSLAENGSYEAVSFAGGMTAYVDEAGKVCRITVDKGSYYKDYAQDIYYQEDQMFYTSWEGEKAYQFYAEKGELTRVVYSSDGSSASAVVRDDPAQFQDWYSNSLDEAEEFLEKAYQKIGSSTAEQQEDSSSAAADSSAAGDTGAEDTQILDAHGMTAEQRALLIFPDSWTTPISRSDLVGLSQTQVRQALNELYAHHGLQFTKTENQKFFGQFDWYQPNTTDQDVCVSRFSSAEKQSREIIIKYEKEMGWRD